MKRKRFSVEQIVGILKQAEVGPVAEVIRKAGIVRADFYRWKKQYVGLEVDQVMIARGCNWKRLNWDLHRLLASGLSFSS